MKRLSVIALLLLLFVPGTAAAQSRARERALEQLLESLSIAYLNNDLGRLDGRAPYRGEVKVVIEHSLLGGKEQFEVKRFKTLGAAERWLQSREREDGTSRRDTRPLLSCQKGACSFDFDGGILHNHLYLRRVTYGYRKGRPYLKTIYLLDGD